MLYNVLTPSLYGPMIINRFDEVIGYNISGLGAWMPNELELLRFLARWAHERRGHCVFVDVGANIGMHTLAVASLRLPQLTVHAIEAQRPFFYQLCGTVALNSLPGVLCHHRVAAQYGSKPLLVRGLDLTQAANFGGFEVEPPAQSAVFNGRYSGDDEWVTSVSIDELVSTRDAQAAVVLKLDIEGMEPSALRGARDLLAATQPIVFVEYSKSGRNAVLDAMAEPFSGRTSGYRALEMAEQNLLFLPPWCKDIQVNEATGAPPA